MVRASHTGGPLPRETFKRALILVTSMLLLGCGGAPFTVADAPDAGPTLAATAPADAADVVRFDVSVDDAGGLAPSHEASPVEEPPDQAPDSGPPQPVAVRCVVAGKTYTCTGPWVPATLDGSTGSLLITYGFDAGHAWDCPTDDDAGAPTTPCAAGSVCFVQITQYQEDVVAVGKGTCAN